MEKLTRSLACALLAAVPACNCDNSKLSNVCGTSVTPATEDFGSVPLNQSVTLPLTIKNSGSAPVTVESAVASGDNSFRVGSLTSAQIPAGTSAQIPVTFTPSTPGPHAATLTITTDDACTSPSSTVALTGIGINYGITLSTGTLAFGCVAENSLSTAQTVTLTNVSDPPQPETVNLTVVGTPDFSLAPAGTQITLDAGGTYQFSVTFSPSSLGATEATWSVEACGGDAGCVPLPLTLTGTGSTTTLVSMPNPLSFSIVPTGETETLGVLVQAQALPMGSGCALPVSVDLPALELSDAGFELFLDAGWDGGWPAMLTPPGSIPLAVSFTGQDGGSFADVLLVPFSVAGASQPELQIPLQAQAGIGPCNLTLNPSSVSFGTVLQGQVTPTRTVTVRNSGTDLCEVAATLQNDAYGEFAFGDGGSIDVVDGGAITAMFPGQSTTIVLTFTVESGNAPYARDGILELATSDLTTSDAGGTIFQVPLAAQVVSSTTYCTPTTSQTIYAHSGTELYTIDPTTWAATDIGPFGVSDTMSDLAVSPSNQLYAVSQTSLYQVDATTGAATLIGIGGELNTATFNSANALTFLADGTLLAANLYGLLASIDPSVPSATVIGYYNGFDSDGDLVSVDDGTLYGVSVTNQNGQAPGMGGDFLLKIDPATGLGTAVGQIGFGSIWGLSYYGGTILGFTLGGQIIRIDPATAVGTLLGSPGVSFYGAAVTPLVPATCP